ncbi:hypothetical protein BJX63DRAFT_259477 [Aspergillus granulosus]|uniref:Uncharacterized protein n=1 Tax=Aspergillus granulosus TaxID=176169 RepID=A0ABR4I0B4_9EURO
MGCRWCRWEGSDLRVPRLWALHGLRLVGFAPVRQELPSLDQAVLLECLAIAKAFLMILAACRAKGQKMSIFDGIYKNIKISTISNVFPTLKPFAGHNKDPPPAPLTGPCDSHRAPPGASFPSLQGKGKFSRLHSASHLRLVFRRCAYFRCRITAPYSHLSCSIGMGACATAFKPDRDVGCARADRIEDDNMRRITALGIPVPSISCIANLPPVSCSLRLRPHAHRVLRERIMALLLLISHSH